jgi:hypothetical protein
MNTYKNILVTTANSTYYYSLLTLISGVHTFGLDCVEHIYVFNLGLDISEINTLKSLKNVSVVDYPQNYIDSHEHSLVPKSYIYKLFCLTYCKNFAENIFWLDAGATPINNMCVIYDLIEKNDVFMVGDIHLNRNYTHKTCSTIMEATESEMNDTQLSAGIIGYKKGGKFDHLFETAYQYALQGCTIGQEENHRNDQSVLSILSSRYSCPKQDIDIFGYWTDINRNYQTAMENNAVIFVHRRGYENRQNLIYEN